MIRTGSNPQFNAIVVIPARYASSRLPGKPLLLIDSIPMVVRVAERALNARNISRAIVATDDERVFSAVRDVGFEAEMTGEHHQSGTDRMAEVAAHIPDADFFVNVQGDEPLIAPETIDRVVDALIANPDAAIVTASEEIEIWDVENPDVVKVVVNDRGRAIYFSRSPVPFPRDAVNLHGSIEKALEADPDLLASFRKHTGIYGFRRETLFKFTALPKSRLEKIEALEQLRAIENGMEIMVVEAAAPSIGVDTIDDLERVRDLFRVAREGGRPLDSHAN